MKLSAIGAMIGITEEHIAAIVAVGEGLLAESRLDEAQTIYEGLEVLLPDNADVKFALASIEYRKLGSWREFQLREA